MATVSTAWDPSQYARYGGLRLRPALELLARVDLDEPRIVYDLGCGGGEIARILAERWPEADVVGSDSSEEMLANARAAGPSRVRWERQDVRTWAPPEPADLIYSNAMLHWVEHHEEVLPRLTRALRPGGVLAIQMPLSWPEPSHRLMRETLADGNGGRGFGDDALRSQMARRWVEDTDAYYDWLAPLCSEIDVWETRYFQVLRGDDPVLEWVKGTGLRPILEGLVDDERDAFLAEYAARLRTAYPRRAGGETLFPFPRLFLVARRSGGVLRRGTPAV